MSPTVGFQPFPGMHEATHESVAEQHVSHRLWDDDVYHIWADDLLHRPLQDRDPLGQTITGNQNLQEMREY